VSLTGQQIRNLPWATRCWRDEPCASKFHRAAAGTPVEGLFRSRPRAPVRDPVTVSSSDNELVDGFLPVDTAFLPRPRCGMTRESRSTAAATDFPQPARTAGHLVDLGARWVVIGDGPAQFSGSAEDPRACLLIGQPVLERGGGYTVLRSGPPKCCDRNRPLNTHKIAGSHNCAGPALD
jgi:hypothetical protein